MCQVVLLGFEYQKVTQHTSGTCSELSFLLFPMLNIPSGNAINTKQKKLSDTVGIPEATNKRLTEPNNSFKYCPVKPSH